LGTPNEKIWPGYTELPAVKNMLSQNSQFTEYPVSQLRKHFQEKTSDMGLSLLQGLLTFDPKQRLTADAALKHGYFKELAIRLKYQYSSEILSITINFFNIYLSTCYIIYELK